MFRIDRALKPYRESGSLNDRLNLFGFIDDRVFLTKSGGVGVILVVKGVDYEGLAAAEIDNYTKRLESAFKIFDEKCRVYQYLFKRSGETVSPQTYENPIVNAAIRNRAAFLRSKAQDLYALDIYYAVVMEGPEARKAIFATLAQAGRSPRRAWRELGALVSTPRQVVLMEDEISRAQRLLVQRAENFILQVKDFMPAEIAGKDRAFRVLKRLLNFSPLKIECARLKHDTFLDFYLPESPIECHRGFLRLDDYYLKALTLSEPSAASFPLMFQRLLEIQANFFIATEWKKQTSDKTHRLIHSRRRHYHTTKRSFLNLRFDYIYKPVAAKEPFRIGAIYHDDKFTYIQSSAQEKPTVYELKDGKPDLVNFTLQNGVYVIPKIVDHGYIVVGKKRVDFNRQEKHA